MNRRRNYVSNYWKSVALQKCPSLLITNISLLILNYRELLVRMNHLIMILVHQRRAHIQNHSRLVSIYIYIMLLNFEKLWFNIFEKIIQILYTHCLFPSYYIVFNVMLQTAAPHLNGKVIGVLMNWVITTTINLKQRSSTSQVLLYQPVSIVIPIVMNSQKNVPYVYCHLKNKKLVLHPVVNIASV